MEEVKKLSYKYCIVPKCTNTTRKTPDKVFFRISSDAKIRKQWCKVMRRDNISPKSCLYCCEDHFNVSVLYLYTAYCELVKSKFCISYL